MADSASILNSGLCGISLQGDIGPYTTYTNKQHKLVVFPRAPPDKPATPEQLVYRNAFRAAASAWQQLTGEQRRAYQAAASAAHARCTGYNIWVYYQMRNDNAALDTLERQTGIILAR